MDHEKLVMWRLNAVPQYGVFTDEIAKHCKLSIEDTLIACRSLEAKGEIKVASGMWSLKEQPFITASPLG